jgi:hypothetical protein
LVLLMLSGIGHVTGLTYKYIEPIKAWMVHKAMALALGASILVHIASLLIDHFVPFTLTQVLIPFTRRYSNGATVFGLNLAWLAIPAGVFAMYGSYIVLVSSLETVGWIDHKKKLWKYTHVVSYAVMLLAFLHALTTGTDLASGIWRTLWIGISVLMALAVISRLARLRWGRRLASDAS